MRAVQVLENAITSNINGPVYTSQTMLVTVTTRVTFVDNLLLTPMFETINNRFVSGRCIVRMCLMYRWDETVAPDFQIEILDRDAVVISQKTGRIRKMPSTRRNGRSFSTITATEFK